MTAPVTLGRRLRRWSCAILLLIAVAIQFVPVHRDPPQPLQVASLPPMVNAILDRACADCHSTATRWPWYTQIAPVSWWVAHHVNEGRSELDYTDWDHFDQRKQAHIAEEFVEEVEEGAMPLSSYIFVHREAQLTPADRVVLANWAKDLAIAQGEELGHDSPSE